MKKIIDSNYLQNPDLHTYLSKSKNNLAVLTDYAWMEAYKGDTLQSIYKSMAILSEFPKQVLLLKGTKTISALSGRSSGLTRRMIWPESEFPDFCRNLRQAQAGNKALQKQLLEHGKVATEHMDRIFADAETMIEAFSEVSEIYTEEELRLFRINGKYTTDMIEKVMFTILELTKNLMHRHPHGIKLPRREDIPNTFMFRYALCAQILILHWIRNGGTKLIKPEKIRNDMVDANFASYGLYFDGILTNDKKLIKLHGEAEVILRIIKENIRNKN